MTFKELTQKILGESAPTIENFTWKDWLWTIGLLVVILVGIYGLYLQIVKGHGITGMRDNVVWGLYIANFVFFIGLSYAGAIISGMLHLLKIGWRKPIIRIAKLTTVIGAIIGPLYIFLCIGRLDRVHYVFFYPRLQSPITWEVIAIITYLVAAFIFLYLAVIRDFSLLSTQNLNFSDRRKKIYKWLSLGYKNTPEQKKLLELSLNIMALVIIPTAIVVHSVQSWMFGMTLRPGWHSTIFGPYFVLAAIYSGTGAMIVVMYFFRRIYNLHDYITKRHFVYMGYILIVLGAGFGYFTFSEYLTDWYSSEKWSAALIDKLFDWQQYGGLFFFANVVGTLLPIVVIAIPKLRTIESITVVSAIMVLAMWVKRYLIVVPTLETTLISIQDTRPEYVSYTATWVEWALTFAGIAAFILMFKLASKFVPIIPVWGTSESIIREEKTISDLTVDGKSAAHA